MYKYIDYIKSDTLKFAKTYKFFKLQLFKLN